MAYHGYIKETTRERIMREQASAPVSFDRLLKTAQSVTINYVHNMKKEHQPKSVAKGEARLLEINEQMRILANITDEGREAFEAEQS